MEYGNILADIVNEYCQKVWETQDLNHEEFFTAFATVFCGCMATTIWLTMKPESRAFAISDIQRIVGTMLEDMDSGNVDLTKTRKH
jgi:hypothetical protein